MRKKKRLTVASLDMPVDNDTFADDIRKLDEEENASPQRADTSGNTSLSGSTPDLESDDDVLQSAHQMGIAPDADLEHPQELNVAKDVDDAEEYQRTH